MEGFVIAVVTQTDFSDGDAGFAQPLARLVNNGTLESISDEDFEHNGRIRVREGLEKLRLENYSKVAQLYIREDRNFDGRDPSMSRWICTFENNVEPQKRWEYCEVLDIEFDESIGLPRSLYSKDKPTEWIFLRDLSKQLLFGPFKSYSYDASSAEDESFNVGFETVRGGKFPPIFNILKNSEFSVAKIALQKLEKGVIFSTGEKHGVRNFLHTSALDTKQITIFDAASDEELSAYFQRFKTKLGGNIAHYTDAVEKVKEILAVSAFASDVLIVPRIERLSKITNQIEGVTENLQTTQSNNAGDRPYESREQLKKYVLENLQDLLKDFAPRDLKNLISEKNKELKDLGVEIARGKKEAKSDQARNETYASARDKLLEEIQSLTDEKEKSEMALRLELDAEFQDLEATLNLIKLDIFNEETKLKKVSKECHAAEESLTTFNARIIEKKNSYTQELLDLSSKLDALSGRRIKRTNTIIKEPDYLKVDQEEIVNSVVQSVKENLSIAGRDITELKALSLSNCILQNFVTVFYGLPGCGKTSLAILLGKIFNCADNDTFTEVQVQRGWATSAELLGFQNALNNSREYDRYGFFRRLENINSSESALCNMPIITLLDEANLSPIEHYWSDFMGVTDRFYLNPKMLELTQSDPNIEQESLSIPSGLRFLATINSDFTTEDLSSRFLSRGAFWEVASPETIRFVDERQVSIKPIEIPMSDLHSAFGVTDVSLENLSTEGQLMELAKKYPSLSLNVREQLSIKKFLSVSEKYLENSGQDTILALDEALLNLAIGSIRGSGSLFEEELTALKTDLSNRGLSSSSGKVASILDEGKANSLYFKAI